MSDATAIHPHRLPEDPAAWGDDTWFHRLNCFEQQETRRQAQFKRSQWPQLADGSWAGRPGFTYPHILPEGQEHLNLYAGICNDVLSYLEENDIAAHREFANLRSSQVCCLNFLFPLRLKLELASTPLRSLLPGVATVQQIEFEHTGPTETTLWLGEPCGGKRGQNRTSADAAIWWRDTEGRDRLTLFEWKYTEKQFGTCGGFASEGNRHKDRCRQRTFDTSSPWECYLASGASSRLLRQYWNRLGEASINLLSYQEDSCPFIGPLYQLMRLQLLATWCSKNEPARIVDFAVIHFAQNRSLEESPRELKDSGENVIAAWNKFLDRPDNFRTCKVETLTDDIRASEEFNELAAYLRQRYGV